MKINDISENSPLCSGLVMTSTHSSRWLECSNTHKSIGNGFPMKKYIGAVVRKLSQLVIVAERIQFEIKNLHAKKNIAKSSIKKQTNYIVLFFLRRIFDLFW